MRESVKMLDAAGLAERKLYRIHWRWHDYLASGMITLLTSRWKAGKTTLLSLLLERIQSGQPLAGSPVQLRDAVVISEEPAEIWHERAQALGLKQNVRWMCLPHRYRPTLVDWFEPFKALYHDPVQLIAVDTLSYFLPEDRENSASRLLAALGPLRRLSEPGRSVLLLHHPKKSSKAADLSPRGSGALTAFADIILNLDLPRNAPPQDRRRIFRGWSRLGGATERVFELSPDGRDYLPVTEPVREDPFEAGWNVLKTVLEDFGCDLTAKDMLAVWPEDHNAPSKMTLHRWLTQAHDLRRVERSGTGRCNEPYRYGLTAGA